MADYIYLLESRLSQAQQKALQVVREIARTRGLTVFLTGGAVRDLTSGSPVRDLDVSVQGNALKLRKDLEKAGFLYSGENELLQALYLAFPGGVRLEIASTISVDFPKPGKAVIHPANILDDLRRRDFTANAMALSLNEGSFGLLMDPLNGVADIENRELRLVSGYGFIEDPVRMIRAVRFAARLGWHMEERTQSRYQTGKEEGYISAMPSYQRGYELEEIVHEEDPLRVLERLDSEGWMKVLCPGWTPNKVNVSELDRLRDIQGQLVTRGIYADASAAQFPLLTAKMQSKDVASLKKSFPRRVFVEEIDATEAEGKKFATELGGKQAASPSAAWKLLTSANPRSVLWAAFSNKSAGIQAKFKSFYTDWPQARQRIPYTLMQEMRITPELPGYEDLVEKLFFELMDGRLGTPEEMKAFLEPYSPPAPPPPVHLRRPRAARKESKAPRPRKRGATEAAPDAAEAALAPAAPAAAPQKEAAPKASAAKKAAPPAQPPAKAPAAAKKASAPAIKQPAKAAPKKASRSLAKPAAAKSSARAAKSPAGKAAPAKSAGKRTPPSGRAAKRVPAVPARKAAPAKSAKHAAKKSAPARKAAPAKSKPAAKSSKPGKSAAKKR